MMEIPIESLHQALMLVGAGFAGLCGAVVFLFKLHITSKNEYIAMLTESARNCEEKYAQLLKRVGELEHELSIYRDIDRRRESWTEVHRKIATRQ